MIISKFSIIIMLIICGRQIDFNFSDIFSDVQADIHCVAHTRLLSVKIKIDEKGNVIDTSIEH